MTDLLYCPFCGGKPYETRTVNGTQMYLIGCSPCGFEIKAAWYRGEAKPTKDIAGLWNRRAAPVQPAGLREDDYDNLVRDAMKWRAQKDTEIVAWLIEDPGRPGKFWLPDHRLGDWTDDATKAVRFLRHNDANSVIAARPDTNELWVAREHLWITSPAREEAVRAPEGEKA